MPEVSLVLPIFNIREEYLRKCLDSIRIQTFSDFEVFMVDDGSKPYVKDVCVSYSGTDGRFVYVRQENAGVSAARNNGMDHARGAYLCFVDPDDWLERKYIETLYKTITETGADIALADCTVCYPDRSVPNRFLDCERTVLTGEDKNLLLYQLTGGKTVSYYPPEIAAGVPWGKIYRRSFLSEKGIRFIPGMKRMQDNVFNLYAIENAERIAYEPAFLYCYRKESGSASYRFDPDFIANFEKYYEETERFLDTYHKEQVFYDTLRMKELTSFNSYLTYYFYRLEGKTAKEVNAMIDGLLGREPYRSALEKADRKLLTKQEYIFVTALKHRWYGMLRAMVNARALIKR